jgi:hypothetical protein
MKNIIVINHRNMLCWHTYASTLSNPWNQKSKAHLVVRFNF